MIKNNYKIEYESSVGFKWNIIFSLYASSIVEEFLYRGFIQNHIETLKESKSLISDGNFFASILMTITHIGFFTIMPSLYAFTSLFLVFIFSLYAGFLFDRYKNIFIPIFVHASVNSTHLYLHLNN
jgi:membrane protease YdiL (CAAX protease family)